MILVSHRFQLIHIHVPKTGGTSINAFLKEVDPEVEELMPRAHEPASAIAAAHPKLFKDYRIIGAIRNPWARAVSLFYYRKKVLGNKKPGDTTWPPHWPSRAEVETLSFRDVVLRSKEQKRPEVCPPRDSKEIAWLEPSCFAWISIKGKLAVDFVCRTEDLDTDLAKLCDTIGVEHVPVPKLNQSVTKSYHAFYDSELQQAVGKRYANDVKQFNYQY